MSSFGLGRYRDVLRIGVYRRFWSGFFLSAIGNSMALVALVWLVIERTDSASALGLFFVAYSAPVIVGGLFAGWVLDRFDRRTVMMVDNAIRGAAVASIPIVSFLGALSITWIYGVATVYGFLFMISLAGGPSIIPDLVPTSSLPAANSLETLGWTVSGVLGPTLAGLLILPIGASNILVIDAAAYFVFVLALSDRRMGAGSVEPKPAGKSTSLGDAFRLFRSDRVLLSTTLMFMSLNVSSGIVSVWLPILTIHVLHGGPTLYGSFLGVAAAGETVGALIGGGYSGRLSLGTLICAAETFSGLAILFMLLVPSVGGVLVGMALMGAASAPLTIWAQTLRMKIIPAAMRGRVFALLRTAMQGAPPVGSGSAGAMISGFGLLATVGISAAFAGIPGAVGFAVPELRAARGE